MIYFNIGLFMGIFAVIAIITSTLVKSSRSSLFYNGLMKDTILSQILQGFTGEMEEEEEETKAEMFELFLISVIFFFLYGLFILATFLLAMLAWPLVVPSLVISIVLSYKK